MKKSVITILLLLLIVFISASQSIYASPQFKNPTIEKRDKEIDNKIYQQRDIEKMISLDKKAMTRAKYIINDTNHAELKQMAEEVILVRSKEIDQLKDWHNKLSDEIKTVKQQYIY